MMRIFFILAALTFTIHSVSGQDSTKVKVFKMDIKAEIDPRTNRYTKLALEAAEEQKADYVIIEMDTYGGLVNDANDIRTRILGFDKPIYVFINEDAASAGALISIACDSIYMAPGANIGAATVVVGDGTQAPDKYQSYMRSIMRSTAQENGRDPKIAEGMVDEDIEIEGVSEAGDVITFSTDEAIANGFCEGKVNSVEEILEKNNISDYELIEYKLGSTEKIISFFLNPFISGILILVIIGGIYFELQTPGVGFPIAASIVALILYLVPYYLNGLAANWEIIMFFIGLILLGVEIFVIPGFGVAGISGIILMVGSLILVMLDNDLFDFSLVDGGAITRAVIIVCSALIIGFVLTFIGGVQFTGTKLFRRIALTTVQDSKMGYTSKVSTESFLGRRGIAHTVLRPSGKIMIDDDLHDAYTRGGFIEKGAEVEVINEEGTSLMVKEVS
jgi:membrane-bound serine protease (ClpP class)